MGKLTIEQQEIVNSKEKISVVLSCPGSGKTFCLVERAKILLDSLDSKLLITTFTKKSKGEIVSRLKEYKSNIEVLTIHGLAYKIIKENWREVNNFYLQQDWPDSPTLISEETEQSFLLEDGETQDFVRSLRFWRNFEIDAYSISRLTEKGVFFGKPKLDTLKSYQEYEDFRLSNGVLLFKDLIPLATRLLRLPSIGMSFYYKYNHILIDEAQDLSKEQWTLLEPFLNSVKSLTVIGDINQSIFGYSGGNGHILQTISKSPLAKVYRLDKNFRSVKEVVNHCNKITSIPTPMQSQRKLPGKVVIKGFSTLKEENEFLLDWFHNDCVLLVRTNRIKNDYDLFKENLMTIHSSKGKEWKRVALIGASAEHIPNRLSRNLQEEKNLFYVACSRAMEELLITYTGEPSIFLREIMNDLSN
jgi:DNA helicase II / ATP-dependent DNA helicase PcrA